MELSDHIRELLYYHDCVIIPGFGGFVTNERSAKADHKSGHFYPPSRDAGFNSRLTHNDGLLISHISSRLSLNYVDAGKLVKTFAEEVKKKLAAGKQVYFEGIGSFELDRQKNLQFDPEPGANFLTDSYGLGFFRFQPLEKREKVVNVQDKIREASSAGGFYSTRKILRYAAIGVPLIAALSWGAMNRDFIREFSFELSFLNPFEAVFDSGSDPYPLLEESLPYSSLPVFNGSVSELADESAEFAEVANEQTDSEETTAKSDEADVVSGRTHYIIAGSFKNRQNANLLSEILTDDGYHCEVFTSEDDFYRVSLYSSSDGHDALKMLRQVRSIEGMNEVWMLSR